MKTDNRVCMYNCHEGCNDPYHRAIQFGEWPDSIWAMEADKAMLRLCVIASVLSITAFIGLALAYALGYL